MDVTVLRTAEEYERAMQAADRYFANQPAFDSADGRRFELLLMVIEAYEDRHFPIEGSDPIEILEYAISNLGRSQKELGELLGARSRASEILKRRRQLNLDQIRRISAAWHLPIAALAAPYRVGKAEPAS